MDLRVSPREDRDGKDVYVFKGEWREEGGREGGKVRLVLETGHHHAKGFFRTSGTASAHLASEPSVCWRRARPPTAFSRPASRSQHPHRGCRSDRYLSMITSLGQPAC